ncbi:hypothetical protein GSS88_01355 [Corynebacterium sp. 3HC-13]|nr:hypothetical protein [Corynebacterium poyangense]MBZ8176447.1 hypothetical protein [Corynebacterium poyangense]
MKWLKSLATVGVYSYGAVAVAEEKEYTPPVVDSHMAQDYAEQFQQDPVTPPVVDGVGGLSDQQLEEYQHWVQRGVSHPAQEDIRAGNMRTDKEGLIEGVDKQKADFAEVKESGGLGERAAPGCESFWPSPYEVCGGILGEYARLNGALGWLLWPEEPMMLNPDGIGYRQKFRNGFIYWHPDTGAHAVSARTAALWSKHGWEAGWLGYPVTGEYPLEGTTPLEGELGGWVQQFQGGWVYRSPLQQVASVNGKIYEYWQQHGGHRSELGFPIADEAATPDGVGRYSVFQFGSVYWHPKFGAHEVKTLIYEVWAQNDYEKGKYGYPVGDPIEHDGDITQEFEKGTIRLSEEISSRGVTELGGKEVSNLLLDSLKRQGLLNLDAMPGAASRNREISGWRSTRSLGKNPVPIPSNYKYYEDPNHPEYKDQFPKDDPPNTNRRSLHDYCTTSPDGYPPFADKQWADFRGPCAIHDLCYEALDRKGTHGDRTPYAACNRQFKQNLKTVCQQTDAPVGAFERYDCQITGNTYYEAVVIRHGTHWTSHIES